jgi:hypothetical protein
MRISTGEFGVGGLQEINHGRNFVLEKIQESWHK